MAYVKPPAFTRRVVNPIVAKLNPGWGQGRRGRREVVKVLPEGFFRPVEYAATCTLSSDFTVSALRNRRLEVLR